MGDCQEKEIADRCSTAEQISFVACKHANKVAVGELNSEVDGKHFLICLHLLDGLTQDA